jgi:hypothetical protein
VIREQDADLPYDFHGFVDGIGEEEQLEIFRAGCTVIDHFSHQTRDITPILLAHNDDREVRDLSCLNQRKGFEKFIGGAKTTGHDDEC